MNTILQESLSEMRSHVESGSGEKQVDEGRRRFLFGTVAILASVGAQALPESSEASENGVIQTSPAEDSPEYAQLTEAAREYFSGNLRQNREAANVFHTMLPTIEAFTKAAGVKVVVCKCMDGRVQTNNHKGLPPTFAVNRRSQGNVIDVDRGNKDLWDSIEIAAAEAAAEKIPLLIITSAHRGVIGSSCAAFKRDWDRAPADGDARARGSVTEQALQLTHAIDKDGSVEKGSVHVLSAMTNTDNGAMQFSRNSTQLFDAEAIMDAEKLREPFEVFEGDFVYKPIADDWAHESIKGKSPKELLAGRSAPFFASMEVKIALEAYLMRKMRESLDDEPGRDIVRHDLLERISEKLTEESGNLKKFMMYIMMANLMHATHYRNLNTTLAKQYPEALRKRVSHAELKMSFGIGFDLEPPNTLILVKPGGGDDKKSLEIGKDVLLQNLRDLKLTGKLPPLVHINIESTQSIDTWEKYVEVLGRIRTKLAMVEDVCGSNVRIMTTYSYHQNVLAGEHGVVRRKQFFPLSSAANDPHVIVSPHQDVGQGIMNRATFNAAVLRENEKRYTETGVVTEERKKR